MNDIETIMIEIEHLNIRKQRPQIDKVALLIIDMQEHFNNLAKSILPQTLELLKYFRKKEIPIIFTRHLHHRGEDAGMLLKWWDEMILADTPSSELLYELKRRPQETIIEKNRYSAFHNTNLEQLLHQQGIEELIIGGVMTNLCCETTARDAFTHDFRVFFLADATATNSKELHIATLKNLAYGFAHIVTTDEVIFQLKNWFD